MENIIRLSAEQLRELTSFRKGETKFWERLITIPNEVSVSDFLQESPAKFVLFGIPEDVGVKANFGRCGTASAYENTLKSLVNIQHNRFVKGSDLIVLGHIDTPVYQEKAKNLNPNNKEELKELHRLVGEIDKEVTHLVLTIVKHNKIPIAIGGGHNNSYGMIKGTALAKAHPVNVINFDAHTDFRALEGRHSGNGFSYAYEEGFLDKYFIFGIHENYTSKGILQRIKETNGRVQYNTYEQMVVRGEKSFSKELDKASEFITDTDFGIEIDLDSIENLPSSAMTFSGFSAEKLRRFLHHLAVNPKASYLHICEGAPELADQKNPNLIGKFIAYLITDFLKAKNSKADNLL